MELLLIALLFFQQAKTSRPPIDDIKPKLVELDKFYREAAKEVSKQKTSAEKRDVGEKYMAMFSELIEKQTDETWTIFVKVIDINKDNSTYFALCTPTRSLTGFTDQAKAPVISGNSRFEISDELRSQVTVGDTLKIQGKATLLHNELKTIGHYFLFDCQFNPYSPLQRIGYGSKGDFADHTGRSYRITLTDFQVEKYDPAKHGTEDKPLKTDEKK
jgi:hypothetical protein